MCGRYAASRSAEDLMIEYEAVEDRSGPAAPGPEPARAPADPVESLPPNYNVTPTSSVPVVRTRTRDGERVLSLARWGLLPHWAKDLRAGAKFINARSETVATLPAFRSSFARRRCIVPADGWFEWRTDPDGAGRQVFFMHPQDDAGFGFAGLWAVWSGPDGPVLSCTILTAAAVGDLREVHDRMPLVVTADRRAAWLDPATAEPTALLEPSPEQVAAVGIRRVGPAVGNVRATGPELVAPYVSPEAAPAPLPTLF